MIRTILADLRTILPQEWHERSFLVGGLVRDYLAGRIDKIDVDLVIKVPAEEIVAFGATPVEAASAAPVFLLRHERYGNIQIALPRKERKTGAGKNGFQHFGDPNLPLEKDLVRRDFTVNAIAMTLDGDIIDPLNGQAEIQTRTLKHISSAFIEDPDRVFRAYQFCARGYRLAEETREMIAAHDWAEDFARVSSNRIWEEMRKAFAASHPHLFFEEMIRTGVGSEFLPEVFAMANIPAGPIEHHPEGSLLNHSLEVLRKVAAETSDPIARCAAFFHDLGKLLTPQDQWPRHFGHDEAGGALAEQFLRRMGAPKVFFAATALVNSLHMKGSRWPEMKVASRLKLAAATQSIASFFPIIVKADSGVLMDGFHITKEVATMSTRVLGISPELFVGKTPNDIKSIITDRQIKQLEQLLAA